MLSRWLRPALLLCWLVSAGPPALAQAPDAAARMQSFLESRVAANPNDASSWRLLGRVYLQAGDPQRAHDALQRAVELEPESAAAHCDLAQALLALERHQQAANAFQRVLELAPGSTYAQTAQQHLPQLPPPTASRAVEPAGYEVKEFSGADSVDSIGEQPALLEPLKPWRIGIESGALYNTNVTLTPTSRDFFSSEAASAQGFFAPDLEYRLLNTPFWRSGPTFVGYFNVNEGHFSDLNLQSYQPGWFIERSFSLEPALIDARLQYDFTHDEFAFQTFANRHALTASLASYWNDGDTTVLYWTIDQTNFVDDGVAPAVTSRDGVTNTLGLSHRHFIGRPLLQTMGSGVDLQMAETDGTDYTYNGVYLYSDAELALLEKVTLVLEGGWGYRDYYESDIDPPRNEAIWRAGTRLEWALNEHLSLAGVFRYDRFDSPNELFEARRYLTGLVTTLTY